MQSQLATHNSQLTNHEPYMLLHALFEQYYIIWLRVQTAWVSKHVPHLELEGNLHHKIVISYAPSAPSGCLDSTTSDRPLALRLLDVEASDSAIQPAAPGANLLRSKLESCRLFSPIIKQTVGPCGTSVCWLLGRQ